MAALTASLSHVSTVLASAGWTGLGARLSSVDRGARHPHYKIAYSARGRDAQRRARARPSPRRHHRRPARARGRDGRLAAARATIGAEIDASRGRAWAPPPRRPHPVPPRQTAAVSVARAHSFSRWSTTRPTSRTSSSTATPKAATCAWTSVRLRVRRACPLDILFRLFRLISLQPYTAPRIP